MEEHEDLQCRASDGRILFECYISEVPDSSADHRHFMEQTVFRVRNYIRQQKLREAVTLGDFPLRLSVFHDKTVAGKCVGTKLIGQYAGFWFNEDVVVVQL